MFGVCIVRFLQRAHIQAQCDLNFSTPLRPNKTSFILGFHSVSFGLVWFGLVWFGLVWLCFFPRPRTMNCVSAP